MRKKVLGILFLLTPFLVLAYTSVIAKPTGQAAVLPLSQIEVPQEFFGNLGGYPHLFEFAVQETLPFKASIFVQDSEDQKNDVSVIVVKVEKRGVTEIGRTLIKEQLWETSKDRMLVESFRSGGSLVYTLEPGNYKLEMSSPNNEGKYRLVLGTTPVHRGYFANLRVLFEVKAFFGHSVFGALLSPLIYIPTIIFLTLGGFWWRRGKNKNQGAATTTAV